MVKLTDHNVFLSQTGEILPSGDPAVGRTKTMAYSILASHNTSGNMDHLSLKFDALVSPDNNYVNILQTARASGLTEFPLPYVLSNCHNTLCAVGGTIAEDDHVFGLSNAKKYGGIFVPPYRAVLHQYMREVMAGGGKMILGSDSHTRYGALGTMGIGEGGGELVKQLLRQNYDLPYPSVIAVRLTGRPKPGVGPMDVALAIIAKTFSNGFNKNKVLEFVGDGIENLSMEYRMGIDVMMTESAALSSIWCTDEKTQEYLRIHGREDAYQRLCSLDGACYDGMIEVDLDTVECMIAMPFHPSNAVPIRVFQENCSELLAQIQAEGNKIKGNQAEPFSIMDHIRDGAFYPDQALVSGCAGGMFENLVAMADILSGYGINSGNLNLHVNPASLPVMEELMKTGIASELAVAGATMRPTICGPCFGVTDVPANNQLSIRHVTRNYSTREGAKPGQGQMAAVFLMDARSIAATVRNGGRLTAATELDVTYRPLKAGFNRKIYENQVFDRYGKAEPEQKLVMGPNIADWPEMPGLKQHLLLKVAGSYQGSVTTDELVPSGEASSYRSNPEKLSGYTMISWDPSYVERAREIRAQSEAINFGAGDIAFGSLMVSEQIGDGSSREQAASCQKVLGGFANLANEYATKRYRSNCINWGLLPLRTQEKLDIPVGTYLYLENVLDALEADGADMVLSVLRVPPEDTPEQVLARLEAAESVKALCEREIQCTLDHLSQTERDTLRAGCLINFYRQSH